QNPRRTEAAEPDSPSWLRFHPGKEIGSFPIAQCADDVDQRRALSTRIEKPERFCLLQPRLVPATSSRLDQLPSGDRDFVRWNHCQHRGGEAEPFPAKSLGGKFPVQPPF